MKSVVRIGDKGSGLMEPPWLRPVAISAESDLPRVIVGSASGVALEVEGGTQVGVENREWPRPARSAVNSSNGASDYLAARDLAATDPRLAATSSFPPSLGKLGRSAVWRWSSIERWARETGRLPAGP
jgi:hypothetical protein